MDILEMPESCQQLKSKVLERVILENWTQLQYFISYLRLVLHKLLFVEEIEEVTERIDSCSSSYDKDLARIDMSKL